MSASDDVEPAARAAATNGGTGSDEGAGVLAGLPRTRPQRASPRRDAARRAPSAKAASGAPSKRAAKAGAGAKTPKAARAKAPAAKPAAVRPSAARARVAKLAPPRAAAQEPVPRQGYESESDRGYGPVRPPGGIELVGSAFEIAGELTKAGLSAGERVLRSLLPRS